MALSYETTGKWTSERHELAKQQGKLTAGQAAKIVSRELKTKIAAQTVVEAYTILWGTPEWHHSGFCGRGKMGRTYFFTRESIRALIDNWQEAMVKLEEKSKQGEKTVAGIYYTWSREYNRYGRLANVKVLQFYEGPLGDAPQNFKRLNTSEGIERAKKAIGKRYYGWDEPSVQEFESNGR